jgi:NTE family protein
MLYSNYFSVPEKERAMSIVRKGIKVGLALGGGYARGFAHIGVLEVLEREGIPIDLIAGTSAGALVGGLYARETDARLLKKQVSELDWKKLTPLIDLVLPKSGFIKGRRITRLLETFIGNVRFEDLKIPLSCVATDIITGEEIVINEGSVLQAVRASISVPVIFTVVKWKDRYLVDGGLVNPVPTSVARKMGADYIIAVNVTPHLKDRMEYNASSKKKEVQKEPGIFAVIAQSVSISSDHLSALTTSDSSTIVIRPRVAHIGPGDFHRARESILEGELAAVDAIHEIKRQLKVLRETSATYAGAPEGASSG